MPLDAFDYISKQLQKQFGVSEQKADASSDNIITNYANCAGVAVDKVRERSPINIKNCFDSCYASAHIKHPNNIDLFEKEIIACMCQCAKSMVTEQ